MGTKKQSSFIRGIENRLSTIFGEETKQPDRKTAPDAPHGESDSLKEVSIESDVSQSYQQKDNIKSIEANDPIKIAKTPFVRGIETRLDSIFEAGEKQPAHTDISDIHVKKDDSLKELSADADVSHMHKEDVKINIEINDPIDTSKTPFVQGIEKQLDSIFEESNRQPAHKEASDINIQEDNPLKDITIQINSSRTPQDDGQKNINIKQLIDVTEQTPAGHENRDPVHGAEDSIMRNRTEEAVIKNLSEKGNIKDMDTKTKVSDEKDNKVERFEKLFGELVTSTSIWYSPLKDLKSTVLSIEWEMTDQIMEKFDQEVNKLSDLFVDDKIILGFLKILRFLGKYVKAKGMDAHHLSVKLLLSIYDDLENVLLTRDMTDDKKREILFNDINKYKEWVETVDLVIRDEDRRNKEERPPLEDVKTLVSESGKDKVTTEPIIESKIEEIAVEKTVVADTGMTPHEAFACAVDEIKKMISAEFSALRTEIKLWRQGQ